VMCAILGVICDVRYPGGYLWCTLSWGLSVMCAILGVICDVRYPGGYLWCALSWGLSVVCAILGCTAQVCLLATVLCGSPAIVSPFPMSTAHELCLLYNWGYRHILKMCNTYCFSTRTVVRRTRLSVMYIACSVTRQWTKSCLELNAGL